MIPKPLDTSFSPLKALPNAPALLILLVLMTVLECFGEAGRAWLAYDRTLIAQGQVWRLITCSLVHLGWWHWMLNGLGLIVYGLLCPQPLSLRVFFQRWLFLALGMALGLYVFVPSTQGYVGMSGVAHGLFVLGLLPMALKKDVVAAICLLYLLGKLGYELIAGAPVSDQSALGGLVILESHLWGTISGLAYAGLFGSFRSPAR